LGLFIAGALIFSVSEASALTIESEESKNIELKPVFNEIRWIPGFKQDIWMMNQSHFGSKPAAHQWERLAIVIDKTVSPMVARYYQFEPGPLEWSDDLLQKRTTFRASCFICHNNGPRALRPIYESTSAPLDLADRFKIQVWNLRIKTYGRIVYDKAQDIEDVNLKTPFRYNKDRYNDKLTVKTCTYCHRDSGFLARGSLVRQQTGTIESMIERGHMPPPGFSLSAKEKEQLENFLHGF
jgi:hypothetical protein